MKTYSAEARLPATLIYKWNLQAESLEQADLLAQQMAEELGQESSINEDTYNLEELPSFQFEIEPEDYGMELEVYETLVN